MLAGRLAPDDRIEAVAVDAVTGAVWVLTRLELVVIEGKAVTDRRPRRGLNASVSQRATGVDLWVRHADDRRTMIAAFRGHNKLTNLLVRDS